MLNRRRYGLQLQCIQQGTYRLDWYTPRNYDVAFAMAEGHAATHDGYWVYKITNFNSTEDPIIFDSSMMTEGKDWKAELSAQRWRQ